MGISVVINTYNAAEFLDEVLGAVAGFDEIVLCDMESTDDTLAIARRHGCRIVTFPRGECRIVEPARNFAVRSASHEWVLVVDADEIVTPQLREYLYEFLKNPGDVAALEIPRMNYQLGKWKRDTYPDYQTRFMKRDSAEWPETVHSHVKIDGAVAKIPAKRRELALIHKNAPLSGVYERLNRYTTLEVAKRGDTRISAARLLLDPFWKFIQMYFFKGGWRSGKAGIISAANEGMYRFARWAKIYEKQTLDK